MPSKKKKSIVGAGWDPKDPPQIGGSVGIWGDRIGFTLAYRSPSSPSWTPGSLCPWFTQQLGRSPGQPHWAATSENPPCPSTGLRLHPLLNLATGTPERRVPAAKPLPVTLLSCPHRRVGPPRTPKWTLWA